MLKVLLSFAVLALCVGAKTEHDLPQLKLPWGTWEAARFPGDADVSKERHYVCLTCDI